MKRNILIVFCILLLTVCVGGMYVYSSSGNGELVKKGEAIEYVLRAIGANNDVKEDYEFSNYEIEPISDGETDEERLGFLYCAVYNHFIQPEEIDKYHYVIRPKDDIIFYEVCQLMSFCLQEEQLTYEDAYEYCKKSGIIKFYERAFWSYGNEGVNEKYFDIMLKRLSNCKRYRYFIYVNGYWHIYKDDYKVMTYNEYYNSEQYKLDREYAPKE